MKILSIISILTLNYFNSFSQTKERIEKMTISYNGDSLITQKYELIIHSKKVYVITPVINYLHIKRGKYKRRAKIKKDRREKIFSLVNKLQWTYLEQNKNKVMGDRFYVVETFYTDNLIDNYKVSEEFLPSDFKMLFDNLNGK
ncbi:MAG TPA: hypothetical protein DGG95_05040 [Cytophagales bacterium]|nr:hypothetical protein [Cytophagales bacterium]